MVGWSNTFIPTFVFFLASLLLRAPLRSNKRNSSRPPSSGRLACGWIVQHLHAYLCFSSCISTSTSLRSNKRSSSRPPGSGRLGLAGPAYINDAPVVQLRFMWLLKSVPWKTRIMQVSSATKYSILEIKSTNGSAHWRSNRRQRFPGFLLFARATDVREISLAILRGISAKSILEIYKQLVRYYSWFRAEHFFLWYLWEEKNHGCFIFPFCIWSSFDFSTDQKSIKTPNPKCRLFLKIYQ